jgi:hypothetical protein
MRYQPQWDLLLQDRVLHLILLALLVSHEDFLPPRISQIHRSSRAYLKVLSGN